MADQVVAGFSEDPGARSIVQAVAQAHGGQILRVDTLLGFAVIEIAPEAQAQLLTALRERSAVTFAGPDVRIGTDAVPNDPRYHEQWGPPTIGMESAWDQRMDAGEIDVAILDTGMRATHEDIEPNLCVQGPDLVDGAQPPEDEDGHGTHVAGTAGAGLDNGVGVAGMGDVCLWNVRVLGPRGGTASAVATGIAWAAYKGAEVISMSLGGPVDPGWPMTAAVDLAWQHGSLLVAAAGNDDCSPVGYPAAYPEVLAVGALRQPGDTRASFSNCGTPVEITAPGRDIVSAWHTADDAYNSINGTSQATPHVSGVAGLIWARQPQLSNGYMRCLLRGTADDLGPEGHDPEYGFGRLDADEAISLAAPDPLCLADPMWPRPGVGCETSGPDHYGYVCAEIEMDFHDISDTGSRIVLEDDELSPPVNLEGSFDFYGNHYGTLQVCSNGYVTFEAPDENCPNIPQRTTGPPNQMIAALWSDLDPSAGGTIHHDTTTIDDRPAFVVQWTGVPYFSAADSVTFQIQLFLDNCQIEAHYPSATGNGLPHHASTEDPTGIDGLRFDTTNAPLTGRAVRYVPPASMTCPSQEGCELPGPDDLDYTCKPIGLDFHDISGSGSALNLGDDERSASQKIGGPFTFYRRVYDELEVCSNGFVTFDQSGDACPPGPDSIPQDSDPNNLVAAHWSNLDPSQGGTVYVDRTTVDGRPAYVVQWDDVVYFDDTDEPETFQVQLFLDNCDIEVHYPDLDGNAEPHTTGVEDPTGRIGVRYDNTFGPMEGEAVRYAPIERSCKDAPENDALADAFPVFEADLPYRNTQDTFQATTTMEDSRHNAVAAGVQDTRDACLGMGSTVWYSYTPARRAPQEIRLTTNGSEFDTMAALWAKLPAGWVRLACTDDVYGQWAAIDWDAMPEVTYLLQVGGFQGAQGDLVVELEAGPVLGETFSTLGLS